MMKSTAPILGPILAGALALSTATATPARAASDDVGKVLLGITALTIIGTALANQSKAEPQPVYRAPTQNFHHGTPHSHGKPHGQKPEPSLFKQRMPNECRRTGRVFGEVRDVYIKTCLIRHNASIQRLPQSCEKLGNVGGYKREVYLVNCLRNHGWPT